ncbi:toxin-antitoxin system YwqK family antitoxin [Fusobacterium pseudoperiodonticum]|uniref:toxin-antitoxin system YwqK family antitoxin n=1 Tax=Fusobacterium pseudoperiodonticum TaxID=2663009 RepID=UPI0028D03CFA|nr:toxin-antitoxin system YwqK family antitoxin [Fusobacterium pseudoperiodonticum]
MKKILSALLLVFAMLLSACGGVKYELKEGVLYGDGKEASGTFEFKSGKNKVKGNFVNGLPDGVFEKYYSDGSIMLKDAYVGGKNVAEELYYKNGQLMGAFSETEALRLFYENGNIVMSVNLQTGETVVYHENGVPLMAILGNSAVIFNENNEMLFRIDNGQPIDLGATLNQLEDGSYELVKDNKVLAKIDANGQIGTYLYSTGEPLMSFNSSNNLSEILFKDGTVLFKSDGTNFTLNYKDGKPLYEAKGENWKFFSNDGEEIISNFDNITDIKKLD